MVQLPGTSRGLRLSWEGGVARHWARGKHPRERAVGPTTVKEAQGVGGRQQTRPRQWHVPHPGMSFLGTLLGPWTWHFLSLYDLAAFPAFHRRAHRGAASARPDLVQRKAWAPSLSHPPAPEAPAWVSGAGWPLCSPSPPDILTRCCGVRPCALSFQPPSGRLSGISKSAFSTQPILVIRRPSPISPTSFLCLNLTPVAPETGFAPKLLHRI